MLAANTSGLSITAIQSACSRPQRAITMHFWNPPHLMPLVEIVNGVHTASGLAEELRDLCNHQGVLPILAGRKERRETFYDWNVRSMREVKVRLARFLTRLPAA